MCQILLCFIYLDLLPLKANNVVILALVIPNFKKFKQKPINVPKLTEPEFSP